MLGMIVTLMILMILLVIPWEVLLLMAMLMVTVAGFILVLPFVLIIGAVENLTRRKSSFRVGWRNLKDFLG